MCLKSAASGRSGQVKKNECKMIFEERVRACVRAGL